MDSDDRLVTQALLAQINHWGYVLGGVVFVLALLAFVRRRKMGNAVWAVISLLVAFVPYVVYAWACFYVVVRGFALLVRTTSKGSEGTGTSRSGDSFQYQGTAGKLEVRGSCPTCGGNGRIPCPRGCRGGYLFNPASQEWDMGCMGCAGGYAPCPNTNYH